MSKYYGIGTQKVERKNDEGKLVKAEIEVVVHLDYDAPSRIQAVNELNAIAKRDGVKLKNIYVVQGSQKSSGTITKNMQRHRTNGTMPKF